MRCRRALPMQLCTGFSLHSSLRRLSSRYNILGRPRNESAHYCSPPFLSATVRIHLGKGYPRSSPFGNGLRTPGSHMLPNVIGGPGGVIAYALLLAPLVMTSVMIGNLSFA